MFDECVKALTTRVLYALLTHQGWQLALLRREANKVAESVAKRSVAETWKWYSTSAIPLEWNWHILLEVLVCAPRLVFVLGWIYLLFVSIFLCFVFDECVILVHFYEVYALKVTIVA